MARTVFGGLVEKGVEGDGGACPLFFFLANSI